MNLKPEIRIRAAGSEDIELLAALGAKTMYDAFSTHPEMDNAELLAYIDESFSPEQIAREIAEPNALFLIAEIEGGPSKPIGPIGPVGPVGYAKLLFGTGVDGVAAQRPVKLKRLYALQEVVGSGVGPVLLEQCLIEAQRQGSDVMWLTVWRHNLRAQSFYRKWGFADAGTIDFPMGRVVHIDVLMTKEIAGSAAVTA